MQRRQERRLLSREIYEQLKKRILGFEIPAGTPLVENSLVQEFGVSRTPIRAALQMLRNEGLVQFRGKMGAAVSAPSFRKVVEAYSVRELLCSYAARLAAGHASDEKLAELKERLDATSTDASRPGHRVECETANRLFHSTILEIAENETLREIGERLLWVTQQVSVELPAQSFGESREEHFEVLDALFNHDPDAAEQAMRKHIVNSKTRCFGE